VRFALHCTLKQSVVLCPAFVHASKLTGQQCRKKLIWYCGNDTKRVDFLLHHIAQRVIDHAVALNQSLAFKCSRAH